METRELLQPCIQELATGDPSLPVTMKQSPIKIAPLTNKKDPVYDMTNLSRALDVAEDKDKAFFDFNKLAEALNVAEEKKKERRQGGEKQREVRFLDSRWCS
ncbi:hypothetical protein Peur_011015 [Populus x canadensis]